MTQSHPPGLRTLVRRCLVEECAVRSGDGLLLAVSGGPDSMALLHVLNGLRAGLGLRLEACAVDHGLRKESKAELDLVERYCVELEVPLFRRGVEVGGRTNLQARAREARYRALNEVRRERGLPYLVTAHHQEDRAETVLLRLLRGAGPAGLAVLPPRAQPLLRPMIRAPKARILAHVDRYQIPHVQDPSNIDARFARVRVRHELLPLMRQMSPGIVDHLTNLADEVMATPLPVVEADDEVVLLNRGQRAQLRRALEQGERGTRIFLGQGRVLFLDERDGKPRIDSETPTSSAATSPISGVGATKSSKSD